MENLLTKRNIIIAGTVVVLIIVVLIFVGRKTAPGEPTFFGGLFPVPAGEKPGFFADSKPGFKEAGIGELPLSETQSGALPIGTLIKLSDDAVSSLTPYGVAARYHKNIPENLGHLFERNAAGTNEETRLSNFTIPQVARVVWSPDAARAVIFYNLDDENARKLLVDYSSSTTPKTNFLPDSIWDVAFSPDSKSMAFINNLPASPSLGGPASPQGGGETQNIFIATSDFKNPRRVFENNIPDLELSWPSADFLAIKTKSSYASRGFLYAINIKTGALGKIAEGLGLDAIWSKDGAKALYSSVSSSGRMQNIKIFDIKTSAVKEVAVKTIAEKCLFLNTIKFVYCGTPRTESRGKLPDAWWQGKISFQDAFVNINAETGEYAQFVPTPSDVTSPKALNNDSYLIFKDKNTGDLWSLKLKQ